MFKKWKATMFPVEAQKFCNDFLELESARFATLTTTPNLENRGLLDVTVQAIDDTGEIFLTESFDNGQLHHSGWGEVFGSSISTKNLDAIFAGKPVKITFTGKRTLPDESGVCKSFHFVEGHMEIELNNGKRFDIGPSYKIGDDFFEGEVASGRRRVTLAE